VRAYTWTICDKYDLILIMNEHQGLAVGVWNIAANKQTERVDHIAGFLAQQDPGMTVITELTDIDGMCKALNREFGSGYQLETVPTQSPYGDSIGLLVTGSECSISDVTSVDAQGEKMPCFMRAELASPLGTICLAALRGAYVSGKGGLFTSGATERKSQYQKAIEAVGRDSDVQLITGDMNSLVRTHDPIFTGQGFQRLSGRGITWPDRRGIMETTRDALVLSMPFLLTHCGISLDVVYGRGNVQGVESTVCATGLSDHMHLQTRLAASYDSDR
jgi:hypothetical protein